MPDPHAFKPYAIHQPISRNVIMENAELSSASMQLIGSEAQQRAAIITSSQLGRNGRYQQPNVQLPKLPYALRRSATNPFYAAAQPGKKQTNALQTRYVPETSTDEPIALDLSLPKFLCNRLLQPSDVRSSTAIYKCESADAIHETQPIRPNSTNTGKKC